MSFPRARRFKYSVSPSEKENHCRPKETERRGKVQAADLVENYRQRNLFQSAIDHYKKSPKSKRENTYKVLPTPEKCANTKRAFESRVDPSHYYSPQKSTKNNRNFNNSINSFYEVDETPKEEKWTDWTRKELADIKNGCYKLQSLLMDRSQELFSADSLSKADDFRISNETSEILREAKMIINRARDKLKKTVEEKVYEFRKETEGKIKTFVEDINNGNRIFLDKLQNDFDSLAEDLSEDINNMWERAKDVNTSISEQDKGPWWEEFLENKRYIRFLENKSKELLISSNKKVSEQEELINILKAELEEIYLGDKLQGVLLSQRSTS